ncbi:MAG TPA: NADH:flavin oxidoreductase, partial [Saprospiraceae bacterium]|nr:NADH:flavin oxidoreductase [Saprospiraceae bacterium]
TQRHQTKNMNIFETYQFTAAQQLASNRIALAPMTNMQSHQDGTLSDDEYHWLVRRAEGGFGIIITCAAHVSKDGQGWQGELGIHDYAMIPGLSRLAEGIHAHSALGIVQLFHGGARSPVSVTGQQPWSASAHLFKVGSTEVEVRAGSLDDIENTIQAFTQAALRAHQSGFAGVELHGAHGYLLHQFLSTATNQRTDEWDGCFEKRSLFIRTILKNIRMTLPRDFVVGVRLSPEDKYNFQGIDFDESLQLAALLAAEGADYIHVSPWNALKRPEKYPDTDKALITYFREAVPSSTALMVAGEIWTPADAQKALDLGADFVALGRAGIGIPDWPIRARDKDYIPHRPPYTEKNLREAGLSDSFIQYMRKWKGFVEGS